jgi:pyruvate/2-oxoglutarate/acetoin dehydrogenase E1 component
VNTVLESINAGLHQAFRSDPHVVLLGEDVLDPYGGAFKVSRGLSSAFPDRVLTTPISEAGIVGMAAGMALRGLRPVVEIMFGDFLTLAADQLINHTAKYRWMYNDQVTVPLVVRTPMGGRRGYGPTHSQTLEKHFLGVPGLQVLAPTTLGKPGALLAAAILDGRNPTLFVENKLQYLETLPDEADLAEFELSASGDPPNYRLKIRDAPTCDLTLAAYGYMADLARQAVLSLAYEDEIFAELLVPTRLAPFNPTQELEQLLDSVRNSGRLLTIEEGTYPLGWGAELLAQVVQTPGITLKAAGRVAARNLPVPASSELENTVLPQLNTILEAARRLVLP